MNPATAAYFQGVRQLCDERGVLFMVDEVQTGLGRCGAWFAHQRLGVVPDVVTMAKALGNGVPIGACWAKAEVAAVFEPGDHATTYGGQPLATAAARAVLAVMEAEDVPARAERAGARLQKAAEALPGVSEVRGLGLLLAVELDGHDSKAVAARLLELGVIVNAITPTALRLAPSLLITDDGDRPRRRAPRGGVAMTARHVLEIDDLTPSRGVRGARPGRGPRAAGAARPADRGAVLREAVAAHPALVRDRGGPAGRAPPHVPGRRDRLGRSGGDGRHRPCPVRLPRRAGRSSVRPSTPGGARGGVVDPGGQPAVRHRAPVPVARRPADDAAGLGGAGRAHDRLDR